MSFKAHAWAMRAPVQDTYERVILFALADPASQDGEGTFQAIKTIAAAALCSRDTVIRRLQSMTKRGLIAKGDQRLVQHLSADRRPTVYDILIPRSYYSDDEWEEMQQWRSNVGKPPLDPAARPRIATPTSRGRAPRADKGATRKPRRSQDLNHEAGSLIATPQSTADNSTSGVANSDVAGSLIAPSGVANSNPNQGREPGYQQPGKNFHPSTSVGEPQTAREVSTTVATPDGVVPEVVSPRANGWMDTTNTTANSVEGAQRCRTETHIPKPQVGTDKGGCVQQRRNQVAKTAGSELLSKIETRYVIHVDGRRAEHVAAIDAALAVVPERKVLAKLGDGLDRSNSPAGVLVQRIRTQLPALMIDCQHEQEAAARRRQARLDEQLQRRTSKPASKRAASSPVDWLTDEQFADLSAQHKAIVRTHGGTPSEQVPKLIARKLTSIRVEAGVSA